MNKLTTQQLIPKLIEHYKFGIDNLPKTDLDAFLYEHKLSYGICFCASKFFKTDIYDSQWIKDLTENKGIICSYPILEPREKALVYLQIRLTALENIDLKTLKDE